MTADGKDVERLTNLRRAKDWWKAWHRFWLQLSIECARGYAAVALDQHLARAFDPYYKVIGPASTRTSREQWLERHLPPSMMPANPLDPKWLDDVDLMVNKLALDDYKIRYPKARGERLWIYRATRPPASAVHCRFCGATIVADARMGVDYSRREEVWRHTRECALQSLAGIRAADAPRGAPTVARVHVTYTGWSSGVYGHEIHRCDPPGLDEDGDPLCTRKTQGEDEKRYRVQNVFSMGPGIYDIDLKTGSWSEPTRDELETPTTTTGDRT
jgi:hypothetical protein